jgi:hypothetical protein
VVIEAFGTASETSIAGNGWRASGQEMVILQQVVVVAHR